LVTVEMTPDEQDVYAWMGISPLVLTQQEVKNPKSAVISVVLPGETPRSQPSSDGPILKVKRQEVEEVQDTPVVTPVVAEAEPVAEPVVEPELPDSEPEQAENGTPRRRRRRSSASTSD
jgi:ribonuclease E